MSVIRSAWTLNSPSVHAIIGDQPLPRAARAGRGRETALTSDELSCWLGVIVLAPVLRCR